MLSAALPYGMYGKNSNCRGKSPMHRGLYKVAWLGAAYNLAKTGILNAICSGGTIAINQICKSKINCNKEVWEECYRSPDGGVLRSPDGGTDGGVLRSPLSVASPTPSVSDDGDDGDDGDENDDDQQDSDADEELREEIEQDFDECPDGC
ncbi:MAG: hypothetical protein WBL67_14375 [Nitrososphaeraceae archaeon]